MTKSALLIPHPWTPNDAVRTLAVQLRAQAPDMLDFRYSLEADMARLCAPVRGAGARADELWKHTCFEAFIAPADVAAYHEFNFSPSLDWAIYRFNGYREGMSRTQIGAAPKLSVRRGDDLLELQVVVRLGDLAGFRDVRHLRIALSAVIEDADGRLSYWGLRHPPGKPDFHHPDGFALELACT